MKETLFFRLAFLFATLVILWLALTSTDIALGTPYDKLNHALAFFALYFLADFGWSNGRHMFVKAFGLLVFGLVIEGLQSFTQNRQAEWGDVAADITGLIIYFFLHQPAAKFAFWRRWLIPPV